MDCSFLFSLVSFLRIYFSFFSIQLCLIPLYHHVLLHMPPLVSKITIFFVTIMASRSLSSPWASNPNSGSVHKYWSYNILIKLLIYLPPLLSQQTNTCLDCMWRIKLDPYVPYLNLFLCDFLFFGFELLRLKYSFWLLQYISPNLVQTLRLLS